MVALIHSHTEFLVPFGTELANKRFFKELIYRDLQISSFFTSAFADIPMVII
jgi:hypothetical protein